MDKKSQERLENSEARRVFDYFRALCAIPHGSGNTKAVSDYCASFAQDHHLECRQDALGNVIIVRSAAEGYEEEEPVIIQGHLDMVCEKECGCPIDFRKEGLDLYVDGDYLKARGTTLGADDGVAVAYALALLEKEDLKAPRLEVVLTVDEETGMYGVKGIDVSGLKGKRMLNLDSEDAGIFLCGCAGGLRSEAVFSFEREQMIGVACSLSVSGLAGGHSGTEIGKGHANAVRLLGETLRRLHSAGDFCIVSMEGGNKDNAIPREASALLVLHSEEIPRFRKEVSDMEREFREQYRTAENGICLNLSEGKSGADGIVGKEDEEFSLDAETVSSSDFSVGAKAGNEAGGKWSVIPADAQKRIETFLFLMPNGVQSMSAEPPGLVQTSLNAGILRTEENAVSISFSVRSSVTVEKQETAERIAELAALLGGHCESSGDYPAWEYRPKSRLREHLVSTYEEVFGASPKTEVIHAGLECGLFQEKIRDLDCVSFGPEVNDIHTTAERLSISSAENYWRFLLRFLEKKESEYIC